MSQRNAILLSCVDCRLPWLSQFVAEQTGLTPYVITTPGGPHALTNELVDPTMEIINRTLRIMRATDGTVEVIMVSHDDCGAHKEANLAMSDLTRRQIHEVAEEAMIEEATASGLSFHHMVVDNNPSGDHGSCVIDSWVSSPAGAGGSSSW